MLVALFVVQSARAGEISGPPKPWDKMKKAEKKEYMKKVVLPKMKEIFQSFDAEDYANMRCETCHGAGVKNESYKMPNPGLPKLPGKPEGWAAFKTKHADKMKFMETKVKPTMAALIGEPVWDMKTGKGFKCTDCHTEQK
jgi:hypothetical protein